MDSPGWNRDLAVRIGTGEFHVELLSWYEMLFVYVSLYLFLSHPAQKYSSDITSQEGRPNNAPPNRLNVLARQKHPNL